MNRRQMLQVSSAAVLGAGIPAIVSAAVEQNDWPMLQLGKGRTILNFKELLESPLLRVEHFAGTENVKLLVRLPEGKWFTTSENELFGGAGQLTFTSDTADTVQNIVDDAEGIFISQKKQSSIINYNENNLHLSRLNKFDPLYQDEDEGLEPYLPQSIEHFCVICKHPTLNGYLFAAFYGDHEIMIAKYLIKKYKLLKFTSDWPNEFLLPSQESLESFFDEVSQELETLDHELTIDPRVDKLQQEARATRQKSHELVMREKELYAQVTKLHNDNIETARKKALAKYKV